jgi:hypothetical protein
LFVRGNLHLCGCLLRGELQHDIPKREGNNFS